MADLTMGNVASALTLQSDETALIAELRAGSEEAFAWLITRYHQPIYSLLARTVQDRADAADLTQEVFVKVFRGVGNFHGESSLRTWIYRIVDSIGRWAMLDVFMLAVVVSVVRFRSLATSSTLPNFGVSTSSIRAGASPSAAAASGHSARSRFAA